MASKNLKIVVPVQQKAVEKSKIIDLSDMIIVHYNNIYTNF